MAVKWYIHISNWLALCAVTELPTLRQENRLLSSLGEAGAWSSIFLFYHLSIRFLKLAWLLFSLPV